MVREDDRWAALARDEIERMLSPTFGTPDQPGGGGDKPISFIGLSNATCRRLYGRGADEAEMLEIAGMDVRALVTEGEADFWGPDAVSIPKDGGCHIVIVAPEEFTSAEAEVYRTLRDQGRLGAADATVAARAVAAAPGALDGGGS